ncbi:MAG: M23 family metallopeptidase [Gemmatimonadaceae bacterium]|nr:M23 family metallopeptidase [Gemmatimonadaceae bacterium]
MTTSDSITAWAAVPIDSSRRVSMVVPCAGRVATLLIATRAATYPLERLRVSPKFSAKPDSALVARQQRESAMAASVSRAAHQTPRLWRAPFQPPRKSRVTSGFGGGRTFNGTVTSRHMCTDYAGAVGAPVFASNRGVVRLVDQFFLGGNVVYLDHGSGFVTAYLHLSRARVAVGDTVDVGTVIGDVGATGRVTGPHLHFIARYGSTTIDPTSLMRVRE